MRKALFLALDYKEIGDGTWGDGWSYTGPLSPDEPRGALREDQLKQLPGHNQSTKDKDRQTAKQLMAAAGYPDGEISFTILISSPVCPRTPPTRTRSARRTSQEALAEDERHPAAAAGHGRLQPAAGLQRLLDDRLYQHGISRSRRWSSPPSGTRPAGLLGSRNYGQFKNADADAMIEKALVTIDPTLASRFCRISRKRYFDEWMPLIHICTWRRSLFCRPALRQFRETARTLVGDQLPAWNCL